MSNTGSQHSFAHRRQDGDVWVATLIDRAGNVIGIWQFAPRRDDKEIDR